ATLMGFPYTYQFSGAENTKWRQIGNAVCPHMSSGLAKSVRISMKDSPIPDSKISFTSLKGDTSFIENLNTFSEKKFDKPPKKNYTARFRRHPFKEGNMTVALTNFNPSKSTDPKRKSVEWHSSIFMGSGKDFIIKPIPKKGFKRIAKLIEIHHKEQGKVFIAAFDRKFKAFIGNSDKFQEAYVSTTHDSYEPGRLVQEVSEFILNHEPKEKYMSIPHFLPEKELVPTRQVLAMYAINRLIS
ncbi:MAG: cytosine methyltransferase, partial [Chitinophagaceae bacterium]|nr:cytosine methyltransferase [Chitinophagaceae bacterium]